MKKFLYFQPEYVGKFKCDGSKCNARCCKSWRIDIDEKSYEQYSGIEPPEIAKEIISCMKFDSEKKKYVMTLKPNGFCSMLTEKNLCRLQAEYGENFLSQTCATYPRITRIFGDFFERSLNLSCPVAAEMILFEKEPLRFLFVDVPEKIHDNGGKIIATPVSKEKFLAEELFGIQGTMLSILQERRLSINQRLIVLLFFVEDLNKLIPFKTTSKKEAFKFLHALRQLNSEYNPKIFLREGVPSSIQSTEFNAENFIAFMISVFAPIYVDAFKHWSFARKYFDAVLQILQINPADKQRPPLKEVAANYMALADARKNFSEKYSTFLENYLVNEFFMNVYPWKLEGGVVKNFAVFLMTYKVFELIIFSATLKGFDSKEDLLGMVDWFTRKIDHNDELQKKILELLKDNEDSTVLLESLIEK